MGSHEAVLSGRKTQSGVLRVSGSPLLRGRVEILRLLRLMKSRGKDPPSPGRRSYGQPHRHIDASAAARGLGGKGICGGVGCGGCEPGGAMSIAKQPARSPSKVTVSPCPDFRPDPVEGSPTMKTTALKSTGSWPSRWPRICSEILPRSRRADRLGVHATVART